MIVINDGRLSFDGVPREVFKNVEELRKIGLEAPQGRELIYELEHAGLNIDTDALSEEECVAALIKILDENK